MTDTTATLSVVHRHQQAVVFTESGSQPITGQAIWEASSRLPTCDCCCPSTSLENCWSLLDVVGRTRNEMHLAAVGARLPVQSKENDHLLEAVTQLPFYLWRYPGLTQLAVALCHHVPGGSIYRLSAALVVSSLDSHASPACA